jgi:hypothetical protein
MATITDRRKIVDLLSIIVRIQYVPARQVKLFGRVRCIPAELHVWRLPIHQNPFDHNGLHPFKTSDPVQMKNLMRAYKNQEWV